MKSQTYFLIPACMALMLSACSTDSDTSYQEEDASIAKLSIPPHIQAVSMNDMTPVPASPEDPRNTELPSLLPPDLSDKS